MTVHIKNKVCTSKHERTAGEELGSLSSPVKDVGLIVAALVGIEEGVIVVDSVPSSSAFG